MVKNTDLINPTMFSLFLGISYAAGFIFWNITLAKYSFFELDLVESRFLFSGIIFFIFCLVPAVFLAYLTAIHFFKIDKLSYFLVGFILVFFYLFSENFQKIPQIFGGAKPSPVTLIGSPEQIKFLENFNLNSVDQVKYPVQTLPVCLLYSNKEYYIIGITTYPTGKISQRVIILNKNEIKGTQSIEPVNLSLASEKVCEGF